MTIHEGGIPEGPNCMDEGGVKDHHLAIVATCQKGAEKNGLATLELCVFPLLGW